MRPGGPIRRYREPQRPSEATLISAEVRTSSTSMGDAIDLVIDGEVWYFRDFPRNLDRDAYTRAREEIVRRLGGHRAIAALYTDGRVHVPGVSDLDLEIVLRPGARAREIRDALQFSSETQYVLMHPPHVNALDTFRGHDWIRRSVYGLQLLAGNEIDFEDGPSAEDGRSLVDAFTAFNFLLHVLLRFGRNLERRVLDTRMTLCQMSSAAYVAQRMAEAGIPARTSGPWDNARAIRERWFETQITDNLRGVVTCLRATYAASFDLAAALGEWVTGLRDDSDDRGRRREPVASRSSFDDLGFVNAEFRLVFGRSSGRHLRRTDSRALPTLLQVPPLQLLPGDAAAFLGSIADGRGPLSDRVRSRLLGGRAGCPTLRHPDLRTQVQWLNRDFDAALRGRADRPVFRYGFPTRPKPHYLAREALSLVYLAKDLRTIRASDGRTPAIVIRGA